jgi:hypothetical protein
MAEEFLESILLKFSIVEKFIYDLIKYSSLFSSGLAYTRRIVHDDDGENGCDSKGWTRPAYGLTNATG